MAIPNKEDTINTESFFGSGEQDVPEPQTTTQVSSLAKHRETKRYLEHQARRAEELQGTEPPWDALCDDLAAAGWIPTVSRGIRLWQEVQNGFYKQTDSAHAQMTRRKEKGL